MKTTQEPTDQLSQSISAYTGYRKKKIEVKPKPYLYYIKIIYLYLI